MYVPFPTGIVTGNAAAGASGNAARVPGVARGTVVRVDVGAPIGELMEIGFAEQYRAG